MNNVNNVQVCLVYLAHPIINQNKIMRNIYLTFFVFFAALNFGVAQTDPYTNVHMYNSFALNPARAGFMDRQFDESYTTKAFLSSRHIWGTVPGFHSSQMLTADVALPDKNIGLGILLHNEQMHILRNTGAQIAYAYHIAGESKANSGGVSLGLNMGFNNQRIDLSKGNIRDIDDEFLYNNYFDRTQLSFGFGVGYSNERLNLDGAMQYFIGQNPQEYVPSRFIHRYNFKADYSIPIGSEKNTTITPTLLSRFYSTGAIEGQLNIVTSFKFAEGDFMPWIAAGIRTSSFNEKSQHLVASLGFHIHQKYTIGGSFERNINAYSFLGNIWEVQVGAKF